MRLIYSDDQFIAIIRNHRMLVHEWVNIWQLARHIHYSKYFDPIDIDDETYNEDGIILYDRKAFA
jgi:hypothetical protein